MKTFAFRATDLSKLKNELESIFGYSFRAHDSSYLGGDYYRADNSILFANRDVLEGDEIRPDFPLGAALLEPDIPITDDIARKLREHPDFLEEKDT